MKRFFSALLLSSSLAVSAVAHADPATPPSASVADPTPEASGSAASDFDEELPPDVRAKLTPEQLQTVLIERARHKDDGSKNQVFVPIALFAMVLGIVIASLYASHRRESLRHETLQRAIARGMEIPSALLTSQREPRADLRRGIILLAIGLGLLVLLVATAGGQGGSWSVGAIPIFLGLAYLLVYRLEMKSTPPALDASPKI